MSVFNTISSYMPNTKHIGRTAVNSCNLIKKIWCLCSSLACGPLYVIASRWRLCWCLLAVPLGVFVVYALIRVCLPVSCMLSVISCLGRFVCRPCCLVFLFAGFAFSSSPSHRLALSCPVPLVLGFLVVLFFSGPPASPLCSFR